MKIAIEIILLIVVFLNTLLGVFVFAQNIRSLSNRIFSLLSLLGAIWTYAHYMISTTLSTSWFLSIFALGSLVISTGLIWTTIITQMNISRSQIYLISTISVFFFTTSFIPGFILKLPYNTNLIDNPHTYGYGLYLFSIFYLIFAYLIIWKLYKAQKNATDSAQRSQFRLILTGAFIALTASGTTTFIIPLHAVSLSGIIDSFGFLIFIVFISYTITRHHLFNIRIIAIELVMLCLWITILIRTLLADTIQERFIEISLFIVTIGFGVLLIRSTLHIIEQREYIKKLEDSLQDIYLLNKK